MKKLIAKLAIIIAMLVTVTPIKIYATDETLYAYTNCSLNDGYSKYAKDNVGAYMSAHYSGRDTSGMKLGMGITIIDSTDFGKVLFPIFDDGNIVATFLVVSGDEYTGVYSESYASQLNYFIGKTDENNAISLVVAEDTLFAVMGNKWYDLNLEPGQNNLKEDVVDRNFGVVNVADEIIYKRAKQSRILTSYSKPFGIYYIQSGDYCYSYALGNLLRNMGYTSYTPANIQSYMNYSASASKSDMANYLSSKGLRCTYSNSGYMSFDNVMNAIYYQNSYIYIGAKNNNNSGSSHAFVIFGYSDNGSTQLYNVWNPWYSSTQTMNASSRLITTKSTTTYTWINGYLYNIR